MMYRHAEAEVDAIRFTDLATVLAWLRPGEFNFISSEMVVTLHAGDWYRCYRAVDYLVRTEWGVKPMTIPVFEAQYQEAP